ncbi:Fic/DOC family protein [Thermosediminibacter litoriperuensis]|uniref:Fic/DOC family protein n=1 Tax=Thermosediminibacter litoriperuensis TaxID=291989 RepID=A0A5S5AU94_9FIRM|nr:Fic family protein [Thermosediminibacter litoriperuensis]TYP55492.1 Fic/DOC family protein [Thermosediminibacter litoriperuensis]
MISGSKHRPPEGLFVRELMRDLLEWYKENKAKLHPVELAAVFHHKFTYIHPFVDGNGRVARLLMNLILMKNGYPPAVIKVEDRLEYLEALEKASVKGNLKDFIDFIAGQVEKSLDEYIKILGLQREIPERMNGLEA